MRRFDLVYGVVLICLGLTAVGGASAADLVWTNALGGSWNNAANWSPNQVPGATDQAYVTNAGSYVVTVTDTRTVGRLQLGGGNLSFQGVTLTLGAGSRVAAGGTLTWVSGRLAGEFTVMAGGLLVTEGTGSRNLGANFINLGTVRHAAGDWIQENTITNRGLFELAGNVRLYSPFQQVKKFVNEGVVRKTAGTGTADLGLASQYALSFDNLGAVEAQAGVIEFYGGGILDGSYVTAAGTRIDLSGPVMTQTVVGKPVVSGAGVTRVVSGTVTLKDQIANLALVGGSVVLAPDFQGTGAIQNLTLDGATLTGTNVVKGTLVWKSGRISGQMTVASGGVLVTESGEAKNLGANLINQGTVRHTGGDMIQESGWENLGLLELSGNVRLYSPFQQVKKFVNKGVVRKTAGTGTADVGLASQYALSFDNLGVVEAQAGQIVFYGGGILEGSYVTAAGTRIDLSGPVMTQTVVGKPVVSGAGVTRVVSGTVTLKDVIPNLFLVGGSVVLAPDFQGTGAIQNLTLDGATLTGTNVVKGTLVWKSGRIAGQMTVASGGLLVTESGEAKNLGANLINQGTVRHTGGDIIQESGWENLGLLELAGNVRLYSPFQQVKKFVNKGVVRKTAGTGTADLGLASQYALSFDNLGLVEVQAGQMVFYGGGILEGSYVTAAGTRIDLSGPVLTQTVVGKPLVSGAGVTRVVSGTVTLKDVIPNLFLVGGSVVLAPDFQGTGAIQNLTLDGATLTGTNVVMGTLVWKSGRISGQMTVASGGLLVTESGEAKYLGANLINQGTVRHTGGDIIQESGWENLGLLELTGNVRLYSPFQQVKKFVNKGVVRKTAGTGTADLGIASQYGLVFDNLGLVEVQAGQMVFYGGGILDGSYVTAAGTRIDLSGPVLTQTTAGKPEISGDGVVRVISGTLTLKDQIENLVLVGGNVVLSPDYQGGGPIESLVLDGATLSGTNVVTGTLVWRSGRISGQLTIAEGGLLSIEGSGTRNLSAYLINQGTVRLKTEDLIQENLVDNRGLFELAGPVRLYASFQQPKGFWNRGVFRKTEGSYGVQVGLASSYGINFTNAGVMDVRRGSLSFFGTYQLEGGQVSVGVRGVNDYGRLAFVGAVPLAGSLETYLLNGYVPAAGNAFNVVTYGSATGALEEFRFSEGATWEVNPLAQALQLKVLTACGTNAGQSGLCVATVAPRILEQPLSVVTNTGGTAAFSVLFSALPPVSYQWTFNGNALQDGGGIWGSRSNLLVLTNLAKAQSGLYALSLSNAAGVVASLPAVLQVQTSLTDPVLTPALVEVIAGQAYAFTVQGGKAPFVFSLISNNSGGTMGTQNGVYGAGLQSGVTDTVQVTDSKGLSSTAQVKVITDPTPKPDLAVHQMSFPAQGMPGVAFPVVWTLTNRGPAVAVAPWQDYVLLSADGVVGNDVLIAGRELTQNIPAGGSLTVTQQVTLPVDGASGAFRVVIKADVNGSVQETNEVNNALISTGTIQVPQQLVLVSSVGQIREDAPNPNVVLTLKRNGSVGPAVTASLVSSAPDELTVPPVVLIPAGQQSIQFQALVKPDAVWDGDQTVQLTASAPGFTAATASLKVVDADNPSLGLSLAPAEVTEGATVVLTVTRPAQVSGSSLVATIGSSDPSQFSFPTTVQFEPGQVTSKVSLLSINDNEIEQTNTYAFTAKSAGFVPGSAILKVVDNDLPTVTAVLASSTVSENAGGNATSIVITRQPATVQALQLLLSTGDTNIARVGTTAVILPGQTQVAVPVSVLNNEVADGARTVALGVWVREGDSGGIVQQLAPMILTVTDDEGPALSLALASEAVGEGLSPATTVRVTRNTSTLVPLTVSLTSSDITEATVPASMVIPAGTNAVVVPVATLLDGALDGNQTVTLTATANGLAPGKAVLVVSDADLADLVVASVRYTNTAFTSDSVDVTYRVENRGNKAALGPFGQRVWLSTDAVFGEDVLMSQTEFGGTLVPGGFFESTLRLKMPNVAGDYWLLVQTDQGNSVSEILEGNNVFVPVMPVTLVPAYRVSVEASPSVAAAGTSIQLAGRATRPNGAGAGFEVVHLTVMLDATVRTFEALTDATGQYVFTFKPLPGEGGQYLVAASHPGVANPEPQTSFTLLALKAGTPTALRVLEGEGASGTVTFQNLADQPLTGLVVSVVDKPAEITVSPQLGAGTVAGQGVVTVQYAMTTQSGVSGSSGFRLRLQSQEGASAEVVVPVQIEARRARLVAFPGSLDGGMKRGTQRVVELGITNVGGLSTGPIRLLTPGVTWLSLASAAELPPLEPGAGFKASVLLTPPADMPLGAHGGTLAINASNTVLSVPYNFRALSDAIGGLKIVSVDEYTYYAEGSPKVSNAVVRLTDAITGNVIRTNTGPTGELVLPNLVESYYYIDVSAEDHSTFKDLVLVEPGKTNLVTGLMSRQSVKYSWTVVPIQIEDRYTITVETVFETAVPKPVVTIEPAVIDLANFVGTEQQVNLTVRNHGLIAAQNTKLRFPEHSRWTFTPLVSDIGVLPAQSSLVIPLTIRRLADGGVQLSGLPSPAFTTRDACSLPAKVEWDTPCGDTAIHNSISLGLISLIPGCFNMGAGEGEGGEGAEIPGGLGGLITDDSGPVELRAHAYPDPIFRDVPYKCDPCEQARFNYVVFHCVWNFIPISDGYDLLSELGEKTVGSGPPIMSSGVAPAAGTGLKLCWESIKSQFSLDSAGKDCLDFYKSIKSGEVAKAITTGMKCSQLPSCKPGSGNFIKVLECEMDLRQLTECKGGGPPAPPILLASGPGPAEIPVEPSIDPFDSAAPLFLSVQRMLRTTYPIRYFFGDDEWISITNVEPAHVWLGRVGDATEPTSDQAELISPAERTALLSGELPVAAPVAVKFLDRMQQTLLYARRGITRLDQVPAGETTEFMATDEMLRLSEQALEASNQIRAEGFETGWDSVMTAMTEYLNRMKQSSGGAVCAKVKVRLDQEAVLTRDAFNARLEIENETTDRLEDLSVELHIRTVDGGETTPQFQIRTPELTGTESVSGTGFIQPQSKATASWVIVPTSEAAPTNTVTHFVSGTLRYRQNGVLVALPLSPSPIQVLPNPKLVVKYFHERDVFSDDPFTAEIEPAIPYNLAVLVSNEGYGVARQMRITSAQPKIVDNEKGLLIDFQIIGSEVGGQSATPSPSVNLGDIAPQSTSSARWIFKSSLQGLFIDYKATFEHLDGLGDKRLSLIDRVEIHEMNHLVRADRSFDDQKLDFLVNDVPDFDDLPDTLHLSSGGTMPVAFFGEANASSLVSAYQLTTTLTVPSAQGWVYFKLPDPASGKYKVLSVRRSDNSAVPVENVWQTDRTFIGLGNPPRRENRLHLVDYNPGGTYTITYQANAGEEDLIPPVSRVNVLPSASAEAFAVTWDGSDTGSGVAGYDLFVRTNVGVYVRMLEKTTLKGIVFQGVAGNRYAFYSVAIDVAGNREAAPSTPDAETQVSVTHLPAVVSYPTAVNMNEGETLNVVPTISEPGSPGVPLAFRLLAAPPGVTIQELNGRLSWLTGEGNGPSTNGLMILASYAGYPSLNTTSRVSVVLREVNRAPELDRVDDVVTSVGFQLDFPVVARDFDLPVNLLNYTLVSGAKAGVSLNAGTGRFRWRPEAFQAPSTNMFRVVVSDNGTPSLSVTQQFSVVVRERRTDFSLALGTTPVFGGESSSIPIRLTTGVELREVVMTLSQIEGRLTGLSLGSLAPQVTSAILEPLPTGLARVKFTLSGLISADQLVLAQLKFTGASNVPSALVRVQPVDVSAVDYASTTLRRASVVAGVVALVNREPVVHAIPGVKPFLILYGVPGKAYRIETRFDLLPESIWLPYQEAVLSGRFIQFEIEPDQPESYFRAIEQ